MKLLTVTVVTLVLFRQLITGSTVETLQGESTSSTSAAELSIEDLFLGDNTTITDKPEEESTENETDLPDDVLRDGGAVTSGDVTSVQEETPGDPASSDAPLVAQDDVFTVDDRDDEGTKNLPQDVVRTGDIDGVNVYNERVYEGPICHEDIVAEVGEIIVSGAPVMDGCTAKAWSWTVGVGEGYRIEVTLHSLTVNPKVGEFLVIGAGSSMNELWADQNNPIFTAVVNTPKSLRVLSTTGVFSVMLVSNTPSGFTGNFKLSFKRFGDEVTTPEATTPAPTLPPAVEDVQTEIQVYVSGMTPAEFGTKKEEFKSSVANMANDYCTKKGIVLVEPATSANVVLSLITQCDLGWPQSSTCVHCNMSVTVITPESSDPEKYELTVEHLQEMWRDLAPAGLEGMGLHVYVVPDPGSEMYLWLGVSLGVLLLFLVFLIFVYRLDIFREYSRMRERSSSAFSRKSSVTSNDSWFPTTHQQIPPFLHSDTGYMDFEPEFGGPSQAAKEHPPPNYGPPPSYGPPQGYGGAIRFFGNTKVNNFDNLAFEEEEEEHNVHNLEIDNRMSVDC